MTIFTEFSLAAGWNNAGSLVRIESITPSGDRSFVAPDGWSQFDLGVEKLRFDRLSTIVGFPATAWVWGGLTRKQYAYLVSTYSLGGVSYRGKVTVRTIKADGQTYANYNAIIDIPKLSTETRRGGAYENVKVNFLGLVAI